MHTEPLRIVKVIDQWGWAFDFVDREQQRHSRHNIVVQKYDSVSLDGADVVYIHNPDICPFARDQLPLIAKEMGVPVIGAYSGYGEYVYSHADRIVCISPQTHAFARRTYSCPTIFLPEGIDTEFFTPVKKPVREFTVGWAGRPADVKRPWLLDKLDFPVIRQSDWGTRWFVPGRSMAPMREFYESIDVLVLTSESECCPRVVLEACACGIPVVSTRVGAVELMLDKHWLVPVNPENVVVSAMNDKLRELEDVALRQAVGDANRLRMEERLSWMKLQPIWDAVFSLSAARKDWNTDCGQPLQDALWKGISGKASVETVPTTT